MAKLVLDDSYLDSPSLRSCSIEAETHWPRIASAAHDAYGCFRLNVRVIHAKAFPDRERWAHITETMVGEWLQEYVTVGMLQAWESDGRTWGYWLGWPKHNRIQLKYARKTPAPPEYVPTDCRANAGQLPRSNPNSNSNPNPNPNSNSNPDYTCSRKRERSGVYSESFLGFWYAYPKRTGKGAAAKAWDKAKPPILDVLQALKWQVKSEQWTKDGGQFIPLPATYLNQRRWEDEPQPQPSVPAAQQAPTPADRAASLRRRAAVLGGKAGESLLREAETLEAK
ncbi:MAG: hypothetical protein WC683_10010 [bacterium]